MKTEKIPIMVALIIFSTISCQIPAVQAAAREHQAAVSGSMIETGENSSPGEILVQFKPGVTREAVDRIAKEHGLKITRLVSPPVLYLLQTREAMSVKEAIQRLNKLTEVEYAEPNYTRTPSGNVK